MISKKKRLEETRLRRDAPLHEQSKLESQMFTDLGYRIAALDCWEGDVLVAAGEDGAVRLVNFNNYTSISYQRPASLITSESILLIMQFATSMEAVGRTLLVGWTKIGWPQVFPLASSVFGM
jgi:hypothetical protein